MAGRAAMRASDAERETVAERLRKAAGEGRLLTEELEQRLEVAFSARTYGQLSALLRDLPGQGLTVPARGRGLRVARSAAAITLALAGTIAALVAVIFLLTGVFAGWLLWLAVGWWFIGRRRRRCLPNGRYTRSLDGGGGWGPGRTRRFPA